LPAAGQGQTYSVVLTVAAKAAPGAATTVGVSLFDPLD